MGETAQISGYTKIKTPNRDQQSACHKELHSDGGVRKSSEGGMIARTLEEERDRPCKAADRPEAHVGCSKT